ncbi:MAG TPA: DUF4384 domain-containing protein [Blastocatellia bacterium]|nr:DUF4384 domain-containing protein [Blastocatellia bacterium]
MRSIRRFAFVSLIICTFAIDPALAQRARPQAGNTAVRGRSIRMKYDAGQVDGLRIIVYMVEGSNLTPIDPSRNFKKGDQIKIEFESNFDGYVYFVNVPPSGKKVVIYPDIRAGETNNMIRARQRYVLPKSMPLEFVDDEKGVEVIQVVMSRQPISLFDNAIKNSNGELGDTASSAAAELVGMNSKTGINVESSSSTVVPSGIKARSVRLAPPRDKDETGAVVAVPDTRLKPGEVAIFEIRLLHQ